MPAPNLEAWIFAALAKDEGAAQGSDSDERSGTNMGVGLRTCSSAPHLDFAVGRIGGLPHRMRRPFWVMIGSTRIQALACQPSRRFHTRLVPQPHRRGWVTFP